MVKALVPLTAAFALGAAAAVAAQYVYNRSQTRRVKSSNATKTMRDSIGATAAPRGTDAMEQELLTEQLSRINSFFGEKGFKNIQDAFVIVVGVGGVGSHAAHILARSGVRKLRLIDFDNVTLSSLNRHAVATRADVGIPKVTAMKNRLHEIVPHCEIEDVAMMFEEACADELLEGNPTFVLDCIDDVNTKLALLEAVSRKGLRVITATGAGGKADPTRLQIGSLKDAIRDPLAIKIRYFLKKRGIDTDSVVTVYSSEKSVCKLLPLEEEQAENPQEFGNVEHFRLRVIPVLGTMPALFGQAMAAFVLCELAKKPLQPEAIARLSRDLRHKFHHKFSDRERKLHPGQAVELDCDDVEFVYQRVWRGRSAVSGVRVGGRERLLLTRWRQDRPALPDNLVFLTTRELEKMDAEGMDAFGADVIERVDAHLAQFGGWDL